MEELRQDIQEALELLDQLEDVGRRIRSHDDNLGRQVLFQAQGSRAGWLGEGLRDVLENRLESEV